ncbi:MAG: hypothetical protein ACI83B_001652 [Sediminicola sp.]|jgi:hypothetical protein
MNLRPVAKRFRLLIVGLMLDVSRVVYEEDKIIGESCPQTEQERNDEALNAFKNNGSSSLKTHLIIGWLIETPCKRKNTRGFSIQPKIIEIYLMIIVLVAELFLEVIFTK